MKNTARAHNLFMAQKDYAELSNSEVLQNSKYNIQIKSFLEYNWWFGSRQVHPSWQSRRNGNYRIDVSREYYLTGGA